jgi:hypothetical protein
MSRAFCETWVIGAKPRDRASREGTALAVPHSHFLMILFPSEAGPFAGECSGVIESLP